MHEDDKEYLRKHSIHMMLNDLAKEIIEARPENPQTFVVDWLKKKEDSNTIETISANNLHSMLSSSDDIVVVDCRPEGGRAIKVAARIPPAEFPSHVANWVEKKLIILYSAQADGLSQSAAQYLLQTASKATISIPQVCLFTLLHNNTKRHHKHKNHRFASSWEVSRSG